VPVVFPSWRDRWQLFVTSNSYLTALQILSSFTKILVQGPMLRGFCGALAFWDGWGPRDSGD
jgi:hypothetical protein